MVRSCAPTIKVNGEYACGNNTILNKQIKEAIGFKGFHHVGLEGGLWMGFRYEETRPTLRLH
jgi:hypothetical protein